MPYPKLLELARRFAENGMKLMLEDPLNVRDLLALLEREWLALIDFDRMKLVQTTFVQRDYRHIESDVVLIAPMRGKARGRRLLIYILIEHQSEPDPWMLLRVLEYVVQIYKYQMRRRGKGRSSKREPLAPVLPVVFYTGARRWDSLGSMANLVALGERFRELIPDLKPVFLNLGSISPAKLEAEAGFFGWVLRLLQQRKARPAEFQALLRRVVQELESMPQHDRLRWLELLSYIQAMVYHERDPWEHQNCQETIETSVRTDEHRQEVFRMGKTIAQSLIEKGKQEGIAEACQRTLIRQLRKRFRGVPVDIVQSIEATEDIAQLDEWLDRVVTAKSLREVGIGSST